VAGTIIADTIQATSQQISLNVGNTTILTASSTGLTLIPTNNVNINVTNSTVAFGSGNVTNPSISFSGNTSTGMYMPLANTIAFVTAGTEDMRIDSAGNVGIGTGSIRAHLDINDGTTNSNGDGLKQVGITGVHVASVGTSTGLLTIQSNDLLAINKGGSIAFGGRYDSAPGLTTAGANWAFISGLKSTATSGQVGGYLQFATRAEGGTVTEGMRIDSSGRTLVGITSTRPNGGVLQVSAQGQTGVVTYTTSTTNNNAAYFENGNGIVGTIATNGSATAYNTSSDYRLKENIAPMTGALAKVNLLKPCTYKWKVDGSDGQGFIAHELAEVCPHAVTGEKDAVDADGNPQHQGVDVSFLVATLTAAIQELKVIVDAQAVEIAALKAK
jgi:hypothetical protein